MTPLEKEALAFMNELQTLYYEQRNMNPLLSFLDEHVSWIGTGAQEFCRSYRDAQNALREEKAECPSSFTITESYYEAYPISEDSCIVYGELYACAQNPEMEDIYNRISAVFKKTDHGMKLLHMHVSRPDEDQGRESFYVNRNASSERHLLKARAELVSRELLLRNDELAALTENIPGGVHQCRNDSDFTLLSVSDSFLKMFAYTRDEIRSFFQDRYIEMIHPADRAAVLKAAQCLSNQGESLEFEYRVQCKDGTVLWILDKGRLMNSEDGRQTIYCILIDITERKKEQEELRLSLERHKVILDQATDIIFEWDIRKDTLVFSQNWRKKFGYDPIEKGISRNIPKSNNIHSQDMGVFIKIMKDTFAGLPYCEEELRMKKATGDYIWCNIRATTQYDTDGKPIKVIGVIIDIDSEKKQKEQLMELAQIDALTGLYNKSTIQFLVEETISREAEAEYQALMIIDLDDFKLVNDTYGHLCGDALLSETARTIKGVFRSSDLIGRVGGDEFLVYLPQIGDRSAVAAKAEIVLNALKNIRPERSAAPVSCSVGIAFFPHEGTSYLTLYQCADRALYYMKNNGKKGFWFYDPAECDGTMYPELARSAIGETIDSEDISAVDEKLAQYAFQMLYDSVDTETAVNKLLDIVGRAYNVSRVYIFENCDDDLHCSNTFEWCNDGIASEINNLKNLSYKEDLGDYLTNFDEKGVFYCQDIKMLHPALYNVLAPQGIVSLLQCAILDDGKFKGYVGFDECHESRYWTKAQAASLTLIANVLSTFLLKLRLKEKLSLQAC